MDTEGRHWNSYSGLGYRRLGVGMVRLSSNAAKLRAI